MGRKSKYLSPPLEDITLYVYVNTRIYEGEKRYFKHYINKYDFKGNLVSVVEVVSQYKPYPYVSWKGDIYQITYNLDKLEDGLKVIKWKAKSK